MVTLSRQSCRLPCSMPNNMTSKSEANRAVTLMGPFIKSFAVDENVALVNTSLLSQDPRGQSDQL